MILKSLLHVGKLALERRLDEEADGRSSGASSCLLSNRPVLGPPTKEQNDALFCWHKRKDDKNTMKCGKCGCDIAIGMKFCSECGNPVLNIRFCSNCGAELSANAKFCASCGTPTSSNGPVPQSNGPAPQVAEAKTEAVSAAENPESVVKGPLQEKVDPDDVAAIVAKMREFFAAAYNNTACILTEGQITLELLQLADIQINDGEIPLLIVKNWSNTVGKVTSFLGKKGGVIEKVAGAMNKTRFGTMLITNRSLRYLRLRSDTITANYQMVGSNSGEYPLTDVKSIRIGDHDHSLGAHYAGHQLVINDQVVGLLRISTYLYFDQESIDYLTRFFDFCFNKRSENANASA